MGAGPSRAIVLIPLETIITETRHMALDRELQRKILTRLADSYPHSLKSAEYEELQGETPEDVFDANIFYLSELGLVGECLSKAMSGQLMMNTAKFVCTARGMDFLADDGGVSAILGTVTVKLHEDTLRQLIEAKVQASDLPAEQKSGILKALREAPGETTKQLITKLVDLGMENAPRAMPLIQTLLQGGQP